MNTLLYWLGLLFVFGSGACFGALVITGNPALIIAVIGCGYGGCGILGYFKDDSDLVQAAKKLNQARNP